jgi:D123
MEDATQYTTANGGYGPLEDLLKSHLECTGDQSVEEDQYVVDLPSRYAVEACQISEWYGTFSNIVPVDPPIAPATGKKKLRKNVTLTSIIIPLPEGFRQFLASDGVRLPPNTNVSSGMFDGHVQHPDDHTDDEWSEDSVEDSEARINIPSNDEDWGELTESINNAIRELKGSVVPKLNWSTAKDAVWIHQGSLRCYTAGDVYLLLQSSDFICHDAQHALAPENVAGEDGGSYEAEPSDRTTPNWPLRLTLRKFCNLYPSQEFRCFVAYGHVVAISQRHHTQFFPFLGGGGDTVAGGDTAPHPIRERIRLQTCEFFETYVRGRFPVNQGSSLSDDPKAALVPKFVMDVYHDQQGRVWLVDFAVWGPTTDTLLWTWFELDALADQASEKGPPPVEEDEKVTRLYFHGRGGDSDVDDENQDTPSANDDSTEWPILRVVETDRQVRSDPLSSYRAPIDTLHVASWTGCDTREFHKFMAHCEEGGGFSDSDESSK